MRFGQARRLLYFGQDEPDASICRKLNDEPANNVRRKYLIARLASLPETSPVPNSDSLRLAREAAEALTQPVACTNYVGFASCAENR